VTERLYVLLPPSLGKATGGRRTGAQGTFAEELAAPREQVVRALREVLRRANPRELASTFSAKGELLERAVAATRELERGSAKLLPAWRRYEGVVWTHVAPESLPAAARRRILVTSGLYGLLAGDDPIADYRLKMNAPLAPFASLARLWRPFITEAIEHTTRNAKVVNLLTNEHSAGVDLKRLGAHCELINVRFVANDERSAVGHDAKAVKGALARSVLLEGTDALGRLTFQGWRSRREGGEVVVTAPLVRGTWPTLGR
jgi:cytoplasmic iron level regulating protein YaaA (DUF328/UPF0246 family)